MGALNEGMRCCILFCCKTHRRARRHGCGREGVLVDMAVVSVRACLSTAGVMACCWRVGVMACCGREGVLWAWGGRAVGVLVDMAAGVVRACSFIYLLPVSCLLTSII